nr:hypothetical protein [Tanacetum cinerariifolium]
VPQPSGPTKSVADEAVHKKYQEAMRGTIAQTRFERVSKQSNNSLLARGNTLRSDDDSLKLDELKVLSTNLQSRVLDLEQTKTTQKKEIASQYDEIASLKRRVKKLEDKNGSRTHRLKRLYKVGMTTRVESSGDEESLGDDASKHGRRINAIDADEDITLISDADKEMFDVDVLGGEEDKGKGLMTEEPVKPKKKDQTRLDEEAAKKLQAKFDEEERLAREKAEKEERANIALIEE